jgi:hypothetical protein
MSTRSTAFKFIRGGGNWGLMKYAVIELTYMILWPSFFSFVLKLFRFPLKPYAGHIAFATLLMSQVSILLQTTHLAYFMSIIQFVSALLCMLFIFRIRLFHSTVMVLLGYLVSSVFENTMNFLIPSTYITFITELNMCRFFLSSLFLSGLLNLCTFVLHATRIGFSYVPRSGRTQQPHFVGSPAVKLALIAGLLAATFYSLSFYLYPDALIAISFVFLAVLAILLRKSYRWEIGE